MLLLADFEQIINNDFIQLEIEWLNDIGTYLNLWNPLFTWSLVSQYTGYERLNAINEAPPLLSNQWYYFLNFEVWFLLLLKTKRK